MQEDPIKEESASSVDADKATQSSTSANKQQNQKSQGQSKSKEGYNQFIIKEIFPDAKDLFSHKVRRIGDIKDNCLVVLDTNILLLPYKISSNSLDKIGTVYKNLLAQERLFIPVQVLREVSNNRGDRLTDIYKSLSQFKGRVVSPYKLAKNLLIEGLEEYSEIKALEKTIDSIHEEYQQKVGNLINYVKNFSWDDPVSLLYQDIFKDRNTVIDTVLSEDYLSKDMDRRSIHKIPPGFKDSTKADGGIGDLIIWHSILELGEKTNKDILFVTHDGKEDWWQKGNGQALYPRYELIDEFRRRSAGCTFQMTNFSDFLTIFNVNQDVIEEVKDEEDVESLIFDVRVIKSDISDLIYEGLNFINELELSKDFMERELKNITHPKMYRVIYSRAAIEYQNKFKSHAISIRDRILEKLSTPLDYYRSILYDQSHIGDMSPPEFSAIIDDLKLLIGSAKVYNSLSK